MQLGGRLLLPLSIALVLILVLCNQLEWANFVLAYRWLRAATNELPATITAPIDEITPDYLHHDAMVPDA